MATFDRDELEEFFEYLDDLRESGETNMFGAAPYLARDCDIGIADARTALSMLMGTFDTIRSPRERAASALAAREADPS